MYDYLVCEMPLPGKAAAWLTEGHAFQTKSLDCRMETYTISKDGTFSASDFTGTVEFDWSNVTASGTGIYTENGEDAEYAEYKAVIVDGRVTHLEQTSYSAHAAWPASKLRSAFVRPTDEELQVMRAREQQRQHQNWVGRRLYVLWGGREQGYWVKVLVQSEWQLCVELEETEGSQGNGTPGCPQHRSPDMGERH